MSYIFSNDWFKRSTGFTSFNSDIKINWENSLTSRFSSYLYNNSKATALINSNSLLLSELKTISESLDVNSDTNIIINTLSESSMTDGKNILVSNKFDNNVGDIYDTLDLIIGVLCHESAHCLYTDFELIKNEMSHGMDGITQWLHNLIEDELIETKLGENFPGYINFISQVKYYYFDKCCTNIITSECINDLDRIMKILLYVIRYPKYIYNIDSDLLNKYENLFENIKKILFDSGCLNVKHNNQITRLSILAAKKIKKLLTEYINKSDNINNYGNDDNNNLNLPFDKQNKENNDNNDSIINKTNKIYSKCSASSETNKPNEYKRILNEIYNKCEEEYDSLNKGVTPLYDIGEKNANVADAVKYNKIAMQMRKYINECKKIFINNEYIHKSITSKYVRNGNLDTDRLVDVMFKLNNIYKKRINTPIKNQPKFALVLTLDESGSMGWRNMHNKVTNIAIMLCEAIKQFSVCELYVYGHGDNVIKYITKKINNKYSLANRKIQLEQNEVISYTKIINDVKSQTNLPIIVINITDSAYLSDPYAVKNVISKYNNNNCQFNCICLSGDNISKSEAKTNDLIYGKDNWVKINKTDNEIIEMINKLSIIIKRKFILYKKF